MTESVYSTGAAGGTAVTNRSAHNPSSISSGQCVCVYGGVQASDPSKQTTGEKQHEVLIGAEL